MKKRKKFSEEILQGIPVSVGIAIGEAYVVQRQAMEINRYSIKVSEIPEEIERFRKALHKSRRQLKKVKEKLSLELGREHAYIIDTHMLILKDTMLVDGVVNRIKVGRINAEAALQDVLETFRTVFRGLEDDYIRERDSDVEDVISRIIRNLVGYHDHLKDIPPGSIIIANDLAPSETAQMSRKTLLGFATERGGKTSHTAIMARSLEIPAAVGLQGVIRKVINGTPLILDGNSGTLIINPSTKTLREYRKKQEKYEYYEIELLKLKEMPALTLDDHKITLMANIELPQEVPSVLEHGGEGIGLYRTEFLYMNRSDLPTEEEHFRIYKKLTQSLKGLPAIIRTLDLGGDKYLSQIPLPREINPALGLRAIRLCLRQVRIFKDQLRGILRASHYGPLRIMFPMISGLEELRESKEILDVTKRELEAAGLPYDQNIQVGCMIETPSSVAIADLLAKETDFFSIGTNDLIQYSLAIDRINQNVAYLYKPLHPAILRNLHRIVEAGRNHGIPVAMCGEMAGEPMYSVTLIGLGLSYLSMNSIAIPRVKKIIRAITLQEAHQLCNEAMNYHTAHEVEEFVRSRMVQWFPGDISKEGRQICLI